MQTKTTCKLPTWADFYFISLFEFGTIFCVLFFITRPATSIVYDNIDFEFLIKMKNLRLSLIIMFASIL